MDFNDLRNAYYELEITDNKWGTEKVWLKKLRNILESNIHNKPLGCKISDTHIRIGQVHLDSFYEAQILFSHPRWIDRFAEWLVSKIKSQVNKSVLVIGYETYIEPVLFALKKKMKADIGVNLDYCIYEEPKYIRSETISDVKIRYISKQLENINNYEKVIFICGISSTLSTFNHMRNKFLDLINIDINQQNSLDLLFYSIIQVLPNVANSSEFGNYYISDKKILEWANNKVKLLIKEDDNEFRFNTVEANYLVSVSCEWYLANDCPLCFPNVPIEERPIIETSETSVIPIQMISRIDNISYEENKFDNNGIDYCEDKINFFEVDKENKNDYKYINYLYYNHIDRDGHHYKYYIRTGNFFHDMYYRLISGREKFDKFCFDIKMKIEEEDAKLKIEPTSVLNVIVAPSHFSDKLFPNAINQRVFNGNAHVISFDPKKEFRSNFETKYSNLAYFLDQIKSKKNNAEVRFYYVDDQLITGSTFFRTKSLLMSLMQDYNSQLPNNVKIFDRIIIMCSRISNSTKKDYILKTSKYHSLIDIAVPSIRNYGDSCPSCKIRYFAQEILECCALNCNATYWSNKHYHYRIRSLKEAKDEAKNNKNKVRQFRRFEYENELWKELRKCETWHDYINKIIKLLDKKPCEEAIAILKAIAGPFIYYKEEAKKATLKILISIIEAFKNVTGNGISVNCCNKFFTIELKGKYQCYVMLNIIINCLAAVDSTYILDIKRIIEICKIFETLADGEERTKFGKVVFKRTEKNLEEMVDDYYKILLNAYKRVICGISGDKRCERFRKELEVPQIYYLDLFDAMYIESNTKTEVDFARGKILEGLMGTSKNEEVLINYKKLCAILANSCTSGAQVKIKFYYYDDALSGKYDERLYLMASNEDNSTKTIRECILKSEKISVEDEKTLRTCGYLFQNNLEEATQTYIISMEHFEDIREKDLSGDTLKHPQVYMFVEFEGNNNRLQDIRKILAARFEITSIISKDIARGAIRSAIQANAVKKLAKENKLVNHAPNEALSNIVKAIKIAKDKSESGFMKDDSIINLINILMDCMIAYVNGPLIRKKYFGEEPEIGKIREKFCVSNYRIEENGRKVLKNYFESLIDMGNINGKHCRINFSGDNIESFVNNIHMVPSILQGVDIDGIEWVFIIGILEVFLKNAIQHGNDDNIKIHLQSLEEYYIIEVENNYIETKHDEGITKQFFVEFLGEKRYLDFNGDNDPVPSYEIAMREDGKKYIASLKINGNKEQ